mgnify:FL=1
MQEEGKTGVLQKIFSGNDRYRKIVIIVGLAGIAVIFFSGFFKTEEKAEEIEEIPLQTAEEYTQQLENNLTEILSSIEGAGPAKVMVTLENGTETKYATEEVHNNEETREEQNGQTTRTQQSNDSQIQYITVRDADGTERALALTEIQPKVKGVVVVCPGGEDPVVQQRIIHAVTTALNLSSQHVCVTK